jgi:DNA replication licensing factor MCM6
MAVRGDGLTEEDAQAAADDAPTASQKVVYVLHPNCAVEEY